MNRIWKALSIALIAIVVASVGVPTANAQDNERTITVTGIGTVSAEPDMAIVSLGVETADTSIAPALQQNNATVESIITNVEVLGVARQDIATEYFNVYQERPYIEPSAATSGIAQPTTFRVTHVLRITVRDLEQLDAILTASVDAGANIVQNITFDISDRTALETQARSAAIADAQVRGEQIAGELNVELGSVVSVIEGNMFAPPAYAVVAVGGGGGGPMPGVFDITLSITVTYRLQ